MHRDDIERRELVEDLPLLLAAVQQMGQALANKSHGVNYHHAREFNELLHLARLKLDEVQFEAFEALDDEEAVTESFVARVFPRFI